VPTESSTSCGIFVPCALIYNPDLPPSVFHTWVQLRGLAGDGKETPALSMKQLTDITAKSSSTLYRHVTQLRFWNLLRWRTSGQGRVMVIFENNLGNTLLENKGSERKGFPDSKNWESPSLKDLISNEDHRGLKEAQNPIPRIDSKDREKGPLAIYRTLTRIKPNQVQRQHIKAQVKDPDLWYDTIVHWLAHRWNPKNIPGMLELYQRGGAEHCRFCSPEQSKSQIEVLQELREEIEHGNTRSNTENP
jgi:hypothetical protein